MTAFPVRHSYPSLWPTHKREEGWDWGLNRIEETEGKVVKKEKD